MLTGLREHAGGFGAKLLLALLVLSFAIWGIGDMVRRPSHNLAVATVGGHSIPVRQFQQELHQQTENLRRNLGSKYSPELVKMLGLQQHVLRSLIQQELLTLESQALGLVPSDADVVRRIRSNPAFQDARGEFEKDIFEATLRHSGISEKSYVDQLRQDMAADIMLDSLNVSVPVPEAAARMILEARDEQRNATYYMAGPSLVGSVPAPDAAQIEAYYKEHSREFSAPEYRTLSYIILRHDDAAVKTTVSEDALREMYKQRIDEFKKPEQRAVDQLLYSSEEKAKKAYDMLKGGQDFKQVAKTTEIENKDAVSLGMVQRGHIVEGAEDAVFSLEAGQFTEPVQSPFGWHIFRVSKIEPASAAPFDEVRAILEKDAKQQSADDAFNKLSNTLEDALAGGSTLQEAAKELGLKVNTIGPITSVGQSPDGKVVKLPELDKFIDTAFKLDEKTESSLISSKGGTYYIVRADSVTPEQVRPLDEVKSKVVSGWQNQEREERLGKLIATIAADMADKDKRATAISTHGLQAQSPGPIKRTGKTAGNIDLPASLVEDIFSRQPGQSTQAYPLADGSYVIAVVTGIIPGAKNIQESALATVRKELQGNVQEELMKQYMDYLAGKYPVTVNQEVLQSVTGAAD